MSETLTPPAVDPAPSADPPASPPAPAADPPADPPEQTEEQKQASRGDKRFATLTAQLAAQQRELEALRRDRVQQPPAPDTPEAHEQQLRAQIRAEEAGRLRAERFHAEGEEAFPGEWTKKCTDLMAMGADAPFAALLVEMPHAVRVAAALADEPDELQRITSIRSERGRAIALGTYAAKLGNGADKTAAPAPVTRAPAPIRPVTGRASPVFNEYTANANDLVDHYLKQGRR